MGTTRDTYVKFGETKEKDKYGKPWPLIEGDSSDDEHIYWTEVRDCSFGMEAKERPKKAEAGDAESEDPGKKEAKLKDLTIGKKVDWGSADLFRILCQAPEAIAKKTEVETGDVNDPKVKGQIGKVVVEVCRRSGIDSEGRIAFLTITFSGVYVVGYSLDISGADPSETVTLKYNKVEFKYVRTNPYTGGRMEETKAKRIFQHEATIKAAVQAAATVAAAATGVASATGTTSVGGGGAGVAATADASVALSFPGYGQGTNFEIT